MQVMTDKSKGDEVARLAVLRAQALESGLFTLPNSTGEARAGLGHF